MRGLPFVALVGLSGCAQIFGINDTSGPPGGTATLQLARKSVGATVVSNPLDISTLTATFIVPDATDPAALQLVPGMMAAQDTWSANVGDADPAIEFTLPDLPMPYQHLWALPSQSVRGHFIAYEHPGMQPAPSATTEVLSVTLPTTYAGEAIDVDVVGAWMGYSLSGSDLPGAGATMVSASIPYSKFMPLTASPAARFTTADAVLVLRHAGSTLTGVFSTSLDQMDTMDTISGTMMEVASDRTLSASIITNNFTTRFATVRPAVSGLSMAWQVTAAPGYMLGAPTGPVLQAGTQKAGDTMVMGTYGNPFDTRGWHELLQFYAAAGRTYTLGGATAQLGAQITTLVDPRMVSALDLPAPLAEQVMLDTNQLNVDGKMVSLDPAVPHVVDLITETSPTASLYLLEVSELVVTGTTVDRKPVLDAIGMQATFTLPPNVFQTNHVYVISAGTLAGGYPNAGVGDLETQSLPFTIAQVDSGVFTVTP